MNLQREVREPMEKGVSNIKVGLNCNYAGTTVGWGTKAQCFCPPYLKTWFSYVDFDAELNGVIQFSIKSYIEKSDF